MIKKNHELSTFDELQTKYILTEGRFYVQELVSFRPYHGANGGYSRKDQE